MSLKLFFRAILLKGVITDQRCKWVKLKHCVEGKTEALMVNGKVRN